MKTKLEIIYLLYLDSIFGAFWSSSSSISGVFSVLSRSLQVLASQIALWLRFFFDSKPNNQAPLSRGCSIFSLCALLSRSLALPLCEGRRGRGPRGVNFEQRALSFVVFLFSLFSLSLFLYLQKEMSSSWTVLPIISF